MTRIAEKAVFLREILKHRKDYHEHLDQARKGDADATPLGLLVSTNDERCPRNGSATDGKRDAKDPLLERTPLLTWNNGKGIMHIHLCNLAKSLLDF